MLTIHKLMRIIEQRNSDVNFAVCDSVPHRHFNLTVNWYWVLQIVYSYCFNKAMNNHSQVREVKQGFLLPTVSRHETNWPAVERQTETDTLAIFARVHDTLVHRGGNVDTVINELTAYTRESRQLKRSYWNRYQQTARTTMRSIHSHVDRLETYVSVAKFIRDTSAETVLTLATGGAGSLGLAARSGMVVLGAGMKGTFRFQDTRNVGSATVVFATELTFGLIPLGGNSDLVLLIVTTPIKGSAEAGAALIEGHSARDALIKGGTTVVADLLGGVASNGIKKHTLATVSAEGIGKSVVNVIGNGLIPVEARVTPHDGAPRFGPEDGALQVHNIMAAMMAEAYVRERAISSERIASAA